jgi:hypothetical protein
MQSHWLVAAQHLTRSNAKEQAIRDLTSAARYSYPL